MTTIVISEATTSRTEEFQATSRVSGVGRVQGRRLVGLSYVDIDLVPDQIFACWTRSDRGPWSLGRLVVSGFRVLVSGEMSETQRGEWCPSDADIPVALSDWIAEQAPL